MKNILILLGVILLNFSCQNQTNTVVNPNQVGTIEANDFNKLLSKFKKLDCEVYGVSKDNLKSHNKFRIYKLK